MSNIIIPPRVALLIKGVIEMLQWFTVQRPYRLASAALIIVICAMISYFYMASFEHMGQIYQEETKNTILALKKSFLHDTVNNLINEIDEAREAEAARYQRIVDRRYEALDFEAALSDEEFAASCIEWFSLDTAFAGNPYQWTVLIWDTGSGDVLYDPGSLYAGDIPASLSAIKPLLLYYREINHGGVSCLFGFSKEYVEGLVKAATADKIRRQQFENDSYIWVDEVLNYAGGRDFAVRLVHPGLPETEGTPLSTDMIDVKGNQLVLLELEGINTSGEVFFQYYFQEPDSEKVSEKLSYAKIYREFDWIIGMGVHIKEVQQYINTTNERSGQTAARNTLGLLSIVVVVLAASLFLIIMTEKWRFRNTRRQLEFEISKDPLTSAASRRYGTDDLVKAFGDYQTNRTGPVIMMFDVDNLKYINDTFGHDTGDRILQAVVDAIFKTIRGTDKLIRWGGDEFVGIFHAVKEENTIPFAEKMLEVVSSIKLDINGNLISPTISIGISYFKPNDTGYADVIKRADRAMYRSKKDGRNKFTIL